MAVDILIGLADQAYQRGDWASALPLYQNVAAIDPSAATASALALTIGHCRLELADADALDGAALDGPALDGTPSSAGDRAQIIGSRIRFRARELCRTGDAPRAARLLRLLARYDAPIAGTYRCSIDPPAGPRRPTAGAPPACLADSGLTDTRVAAMRQRAAGRRLLMVYRRAFFHVPGRTYEHCALALDSARRFGFEVRHLNSNLHPDNPDRAAFPAALEAAIADFAPDIIVYDELFEADPMSRDPVIGAAVLEVLAAARRVRGIAVVNVLYDAWQVRRDALFRGLGHGVDLIAHMNPFLLGCGTPAENAAVFCWMTPIDLPAPAVPRATIARAGFVGSVYGASIPRLVWWAESARQGLRLDFLETDHVGAQQRSDQEFADLLHAYQLSVNLTRRDVGQAIITGRTIEVLISGGVLLEEASVDSAYFLQPGLHYEEFATLADLRDLIDTLLDDPGRRARLADAGHHWARTYFAGDYFWAGVTQRLRG